jgi:hypothetical protein
MSNVTLKLIEAYLEISEKKKLDPVDAKALKGKHDDREDGDIDNDGDEDESDEYLHNRRKAVKKAMDEGKEECPKCEGEGCDHCDDKGYHMTNEALSPQQIAKMKKQYATTGDRISTDSAMKMSAMVKKFGDEELVQLAKADIKWVSTSAITALIIKGKAKMLDESVIDEAVEPLDEAAMKGNYAKVIYDYREDYYFIRVYKNGKQVAEDDGYFGANEKGNPLIKKFTDLVKKAKLNPEGMPIVNDDGKKGVFKANKFNWNVKEEVSEAMTISRKMAQRALANVKAQPKDKVSLKKAPWDKDKKSTNEEEVVMNPKQKKDEKGSDTMNNESVMPSVYARILENRAKQTKGATAPEGMMDNSKSSKGAMDMVNQPVNVNDDDEKGHDDAAKAGRASPNAKARSGDNMKGDKKVIPSATKMKG